MCFPETACFARDNPMFPLANNQRSVFGSFAIPNKQSDI
jgi:hypothetical protein